MTSVPEDPQDWTDEEWLAWLAAGDVAVDQGADAAALPPTPPRRPNLGSEMLGAAMRGLAEAMYGPRERPAIVVDASGDPPGDKGLDVQLDFEQPERSVVVVRPWLLRHLRRDGGDGGGRSGG